MDDTLINFALTKDIFRHDISDVSIFQWDCSHINWNMQYLDMPISVTLVMFNLVLGLKKIIVLYRI
jgi:hypothetical protein